MPCFPLPVRSQEFWSHHKGGISTVFFGTLVKFFGIVESFRGNIKLWVFFFFG
jgi:hypothetical protein